MNFLTSHYLKNRVWNRIMKCVICRKELDNKEKNICKTCFEVFRIKYPDKNKFKKILEWHKKNLEQMEEE